MKRLASRRSRPARQDRSHQRRHRQLLVETLENRRVLAPVITGLTAPPVNEGSELTLTVDFSEPALLTNAYTLRVDWGDGTPEQIETLDAADITVVDPATGAMRTVITRAYPDDLPTGTATDPRTITVAMFDSSVVSYWAFDEAAGPNVVDLLGDNDGTLGAGVVRVPGAVGGGLEFNDIADDFVNVLNGPDYVVTSGIAVEALIRPTWNGAGYDEIFRKEDGGLRILFSFQNDPNNPGAQPPVAAGPVLSLGLNIANAYNELDMPLNVNLSALAGGNANSGTIYLNAPGGALGPNDVVLRDGAFHHVVGSYDVATGEKAIWVDGVKRYSFSLAAGSPITTGAGAIATIGNVAPNGGEPFTGVIDEVAFYNRSLTAQAVADHSTRGRAGQNYFFKTVDTAVNNVAPTFELGANVNINEGGAFALDGTFTDPGADTFTATVDYGTGSGPQPLTLTGNTFSLSNVYADDGAFTVTVTINDDDLGAFSDTLTVTVQNVPPVLTPAVGATIPEDSTTPFVLATYTDPGTSDVHTVTVDWGDGSPVSAGIVDQATDTVSGSHAYATPGTYTAIVTINDGDGGSDVETVEVTVTNVPPTVIIDGPGTTVRNRPTTFTFSTDDGLTDPGAPVTYEIDWDGDGEVDETIEGTAGETIVEHIFPIDGDIIVGVTAIDEFGDASDLAEFPITVNVFELVLNEEGGEDLVFGGTFLADRIVVTMLSRGGIKIRSNNVFYRVPDPSGKIIIFAGDGSDHITIASHLLYDTELHGQAGNDYIAGGRFNDILDGGAGNDRLIDSFGSNSYFGGDGADNIVGGKLDDRMFGGDGRDTLNGGAGNDVMDGGEGNDSLTGLNGDDILFGGPGNDLIRGDRGHDVIDAGDGNDRIHGGTGRDVLIGGRQADQVYGGSDDDLFVHSALDLGNEGELEADLISLMGILEDWLRPTSIEDRIDRLSDRLNDGTIEDDRSRDGLYGETDNDWFLTSSADTTPGRRSTDVRQDL